MLVCGSLVEPRLLAGDDPPIAQRPASIRFVAGDRNVDSHTASAEETVAGTPTDAVPSCARNAELGGTDVLRRWTTRRDPDCGSGSFRVRSRVSPASAFGSSMQSRGNGRGFPNNPRGHDVCSESG